MTGALKWPLELLPPQPLSLFRRAHIYLCHPAFKNGARDECCPRFMFRSTGGRRCCSTSRAHWWPARVTRPVLSLKRRLHHFNACRPKVLQLGAAPSTCRLSTGCSTGELQEVKLVVRLGTAPSLPS